MQVRVNAGRTLSEIDGPAGDGVTLEGATFRRCDASRLRRLEAATLRRLGVMALGDLDIFVRHGSWDSLTSVAQPHTRVSRRLGCSKNATFPPVDWLFEGFEPR